MKFRIMALVTLALAFGVLSTAQAKKPEAKGRAEAAWEGRDDEHEHDRHHDGRHEADMGDLLRAGISHELARRYAGDYHVVGYKPLPPGIRKNLARGKPIPPGIAMTRLPDGYRHRLPYYPGYEWRGYGADLVLVHLISHKIADVIVDALR